MVYTVHILACIVYNDIHNAWVPVCGTLCILYQDHKLDSVCLLLTTYLQSAVDLGEEMLQSVRRY